MNFFYIKKWITDRNTYQIIGKTGVNPRHYCISKNGHTVQNLSKSIQNALLFSLFLYFFSKMRLKSQRLKHTHNEHMFLC